MGRGRGRRDNELIGQTVRISQGPYKGQTEVHDAASVMKVIKNADQFPVFLRLHRRGEGRHRVDGKSRAALHLSNHLSGPAAPHHHVRPENCAIAASPAAALTAASAQLSDNPTTTKEAEPSLATQRLDRPVVSKATKSSSVLKTKQKPSTKALPTFQAS